MVQPAETRRRSDRLMLAIKCAYWLALMVMAAVTVASFLMLQQMMAHRQSEAALADMASEQRVLSQRVLYLAHAASRATGANSDALREKLHEAVTTFDRNYEMLLNQIGADSGAKDVRTPGSINAILFSAPHHLDHFAIQLTAIGQRLAVAIAPEFAPVTGNNGPDGLRRELAMYNLVGTETLDGFKALSHQLSKEAETRGQHLMTVHRNLFYLTMAVIIAIALFIFRPMSSMIERRTDQLLKARNAMAHAASHDSLTGLRNRAYLIENFASILANAKLVGGQVAVLQIDLDRFKQINDTLGHAAGDTVLVRTAERMRAVCRKDDLTVRLGGDEFVVVISCPSSFDSIEIMAQRLLERINEPVFFNGTPILPGASVGIAIYPEDGLDAGDLMVHADLALYSVKGRGGGSSAFFSGELRAELDQLKEFAQDIKDAINAKSFSVFYQPQVEIRTGRISGIEALVRWRHAKRGTISPATFLPIAERSGLMSRIGRIVLEKAILDAGAWHKAGVDFGRLAINVSAAELHEADFESFVHETLAAANLPPEKLALEIVESVILDDEKTGIATKLRALRAAGIKLELDDFGTGYASLTHIDPMQIDRVKIDRRFVQDINSRPDNAKIVRAMSDLAQSLGIGVIAEGAETQAELDMLRDLGCLAVQGYVIAFPMPATETRAWLTQRWSVCSELPLKSAVA